MIVDEIYDVNFSFMIDLIENLSFIDLCLTIKIDQWEKCQRQLVTNLILISLLFASNQVWKKYFYFYWRQLEMIAQYWCMRKLKLRVT